MYVFFWNILDISSFSLLLNINVKVNFDNGKSRINLCEIISGRLLLLEKYVKILTRYIFRIKE